MKKVRPLQVIWSTLRRPVRADYKSEAALGWLILLLFVVQIVTGCLLSFYYQPSPELAAESVTYIMRDVNWGWLIRGAHYWAAVGMIGFGVVQALRVLATGVYRARPGNWYLGWILMLLVLSFTFSGELLTGDQEAYLLVTRALETLERIPVIGASLSVALRGGAEIGAATVARVHAVHVMILPWLMLVLVLLNLWLLAQKETDVGGDA